MNNVREVKKEIKQNFQLEDLCGHNLNSERTAFVGKVGSGEFGLYLITHDCIALARAPSATWYDGKCDVKVARFVDIDIKIVERDNG